MNPEVMEMELKIEKSVLNRDEFHEGFTLRASAAGFCPRLMDYELQQPLPQGDSGIDYKQAMRMLSGTALHEMWQNILKETLGDDFGFIEGELIVNCSDGTHQVDIPGHPDGIIKSMSALYELKTVGTNTFNSIAASDEPLVSHYEQANFYASELGLPNVLNHYFNRDSCDSLFLLSSSSPQLFDKTKRKFLQRVKNQESGVLETRPYNDPTGSPCFFCSRKEECYEGWIEEVKGMGTMHISQESNEGRMVEDCLLARSVRLNADKTEKGLKESLAKFMIGANTKTMTVDETEAKVVLTLGKNGNPLINIKEKKK